MEVVHFTHTPDGSKVPGVEDFFFSVGLKRSYLSVSSPSLMEKRAFYAGECGMKGKQLPHQGLGRGLDGGSPGAPILERTREQWFGVLGGKMGSVAIRILPLQVWELEEVLAVAQNNGRGLAGEIEARKVWSQGEDHPLGNKGKTGGTQHIYYPVSQSLILSRECAG